MWARLQLGAGMFYGSSAVLSVVSALRGRRATWRWNELMGPSTMRGLGVLDTVAAKPVPRRGAQRRERASKRRKFMPKTACIGHLPLTASVGVECAGFSARCLRLVHGTALPQTLLRSRDVWGARTALESRDLAIGARAGAQWRGRRAGGSGGCEGVRGSGAHRPAPGAAVTSRRGPGAARMTTHAALLRRR